MGSRQVKDFLYGQVAMLAKATSSPKRLELLDLLCQGEKTVESLSEYCGISVKLTSAHLKELKGARLVETRRAGRFIHYRLADEKVAAFWVALRSLAEERILELKTALGAHLGEPDSATPITRKELLERSKRGDVILLDVRPAEEFSAGHLPHARSVPPGELKKILKTLPKSKEIVAYCRGPYCLWAQEAATLLRKQGFRARHLREGVADWSAAGVSLEQGKGD